MPYENLCGYLQCSYLGINFYLIYTGTQTRLIDVTIKQANPSHYLPIVIKSLKSRILQLLSILYKMI